MWRRPVMGPGPAPAPAPARVRALWGQQRRAAAKWVRVRVRMQTLGVRLRHWKMSWRRSWRIW